MTRARIVVSGVGGTGGGLDMTLRHGSRFEGAVVAALSAGPRQDPPPAS
ncbi:MAG TPA: hypothetical protein VFM54_23320 [Micromonosporaceae bacterium]|nr:hypothetical protein [Micromonosporaceae bacterium]